MTRVFRDPGVLILGLQICFLFLHGAPHRTQMEMRAITLSLFHYSLWRNSKPLVKTDASRRMYVAAERQSPQKVKCE